MVGAFFMPKSKPLPILVGYIEQTPQHNYVLFNRNALKAHRHCQAGE